MRKWLAVGIALLLFPWLLSLLWMNVAGEKIEETDSEQVLAESRGVSEKRILMERDEIRTYMALEDYLPGVILCQMDPDAPMEALKCQAVVARTYICRMMEGREEIQEEELDLEYPGTMDRRILLEKEHALKQLERCREAVQETSGMVMKWENREILPLFHRMSAGRTRKGADDFPYLQPVESPWDAKADDAAARMEWSRAEFAQLVGQIPNVRTGDGTLSADEIQIVEKDDSGYVLQVKIGAGTCSGEAFQYALGLPSCCYTLETDASSVRALVRGSGHGYGLSQNGAVGMAEEGWHWEDILHYYYKNISIVSE
ncbi:MAG: SpoIID/LytB domain-containing protein [Lachnospiraceae bacterium]|nr:SpoIID/LytB domain-containing protein [Lachnospiraceae bacterium]